MIDKEERGSAVPPSPKDVMIRTMKSDRESMALRGGDRPEYEKVEFYDKVPKEKPGPVPGQPLPPEHSNWWTFGWIMGGAVILGALVYFIYPFIAVKPSPEEPILPPIEDGGGLPEVPPYLVVPKFFHQSFFKEAADETLSSTFSVALVKDEVSLSYNEKILEILKGASKNTKMIEVFLEKEGDRGQHLGLVEFTKVAEAEFLDLEFLADNFNPDFTFFIFKDGVDFWPGLIAKPKSGKSLALLQSEVLKLESSGNLVNLFLKFPGQGQEKFQDILILGEPTRKLEFPDGGGEFIYGWFHGFLVISTSEAGLKEAALRL